MNHDTLQTKRIRQTITRLINRFEQLIERGYYARSMRNMEAITQLRNKLMLLTNQGLKQHQRMLITDADIIRQMMPSAQSKHWKLRNEIIEILEAPKTLSYEQ